MKCRITFRAPKGEYECIIYKNIKELGERPRSEPELTRKAHSIWLASVDVKKEFGAEFDLVRIEEVHED